MGTRLHPARAERGPLKDCLNSKSKYPCSSASREAGHPDIRFCPGVKQRRAKLEHIYPGGDLSAETSDKSLARPTWVEEHWQASPNESFEGNMINAEPRRVSMYTISAFASPSSRSLRRRCAGSRLRVSSLRCATQMDVTFQDAAREVLTHFTTSQAVQTLCRMRAKLPYQLIARVSRECRGGASHSRAIIAKPARRDS